MFTLIACVTLCTIFTISGIPDQMPRSYNLALAVFFCAVGAACLTMLVFLIIIIRKTFTNELNQEMKQLVISEVIFVVTFLLRVALILCVQMELWIDFSRDYPHEMKVGFKTAMFPTQFLVYNFVPYITLMYMHYKNFTPIDINV